MKRKACKSCGAEDGPICFSDDDWCSDRCRKKLGNKIRGEKKNANL